MEQVLLYDPTKSAKVRKMKVTLIRMGVRIVNVTEDMLDWQVGELLGITGDVKNMLSQKTENTSGKVHDVMGEFNKQTLQCKDEVLVMHQFSNEKMDVMLQGFKKSGVSKVNLKAIVTATNVHWTFAQLIMELQREHEAYRK